MGTGTYNKKLKIIYLLMSVPAMLVIFIFTLFPVIYSIGASFTNFSLRRAGVKFIGLDNFISFFEDPNMPIIMKNTFQYVFGVIIVQFLLGFIFAMLLSNIGKGRSFFSAVLFVPWVISQVLAVTAWRLLFHDSYGLINYFLKNWGFDPVGFFSERNLVLPTVMGLNMWAGYAFSMTIMLSALKSVPLDVHESARIDGANGMQRLFFITLPLIKYAVATNIILITIYTFNIFTYVFALTNGGPLNYTEIIGLSMYKAAFTSGRLGYGASISVIMLIFNLVLALIYMYLFKRKDKEAI